MKPKLKKYERYYENLTYVRCFQCDYDTAYYHMFTCSSGVGVDLSKRVIYICDTCGDLE